MPDKMECAFDGDKPKLDVHYECVGGGCEDKDYELTWSDSLGGWSDGTPNGPILGFHAEGGTYTLVDSNLPVGQQIIHFDFRCQPRFRGVALGVTDGKGCTYDVTFYALK